MVRRRWIVGAAALLAWSTAVAGMEWQLIDPGVPMASDAGHLVHMTTTGVTYLRIEEQFMVPQFWTLQGSTWTRRLEATYPEAFFKASLAYDPDRNVIVRFGGADKNLLIRDETWEFDGTSWTRRTDVGAPPGRIRAGMAYDTNRHVMVLFGGYDNNDQALNDTWEYDGIQWQLRALNTKPPVRYDPAMSYDANRRRIVMAFGRSNTVAAFNDTWEFNGNKWNQPNVQTLPAPRSLPASAYDPIRQAVYVFGGEPSGQTIRWTGSSWDAVTVGSHPVGRYSSTMAFDASRGKIVLYGGDDGTFYVGDSWEFDGTAWTQFATDQYEANRYFANAAFDPVNDRGVMFGGNCCSNTVTDKTSEWNGSSWSSVSAPVNPGHLEEPAMAWSPTDGVLLFGGFNAALNSVINRTWTYDAAVGAWTELAPPVRPPARTNASMVYSPSHGGIVLFGGQVAAGYGSNDTWLFREGNWQEIVSPSRPQIREHFGLAADTWRGNVVLYGGRFSNGLADTWVLNGSSWTELPVSGPGIRRSHRMTFDSNRGVCVLATGAGESDSSEQTWEFNGAAWSATTTRYSPDMRRHSASMFWDSRRGVTVLTGGLNSTSRPYSDTWAYGPDDDGDLRVGGYDNCPSVANPNQANADADAAGDLCDCAPSDPGAWSAPQLVGGLLVSGTGTTTLTWADQSATVGPGVRYDVATGDLIVLQSSGSYAGATCLANQTAVPSANDARLLTPGNGYWYLVRARNVCGLGMYGAPALDGASPCP